jgi:ATP-binding cassette subfamily B protein
MKQVIRLAGGKRKELTWSAVLAALGAILTVVPWILIFEIIRYYLSEGAGASGEYLMSLVLWSLLAVTVSYVLRISAFVFSHIAAFDLLYRIRSRLAAHLGRLPMGYWNSRSTGHVRKVIQEDVELIENSIAHHIPDFVAGLITPVIILVFLFTVDWRLALVSTVPLALGLLLVRRMYSGMNVFGDRKRNNRELVRLYHDSLEEMHSRTVEYVRGMPVVKIFNLTVESFARLKSSITRYRDLVEKWSRGLTPFWAAFTALILGGGVFILPVALWLLSTGQTDVPTVILFLLLGTGCFAGMAEFMRITSSVMMINEGTRRISEILDTDPISEPAEPSVAMDCDVSLRNVFFRYSDQGPDVLEDVSMDVDQGQFVALVGPSGSGKSTLSQLIARIWDVTGGSISIGGADLRDLGSDGVNSLVGTVFQDVQMLTASVEDNIRMGDRESSLEDVIAAARTAAIHDLIMELPSGYQTLIGEGGEVHLSGGERQRISLARVILRDQPVIVLDEATAYADAENESRIQEAFSEMTRGKTVVVIAHRLSTVMNADRIFVVDGGRIVQRGSHEQLVGEEAGLYRRMWNAHIRAGEWAFRSRSRESREKAV